MRVDVQMVDTLGIESRGAPDQTVYFVSFLEQQLCQIRAILAGNPGNQGSLHEVFLTTQVSAAPLNSAGKAGLRLRFRQSPHI
jgi:hypothetical protein